ncbi:MAG: hypothetical protein CL933_17055 [Deltaproteobacteria bacterium]|nr:hypothetical protein [Deltaproteobacteria bacterium]
MTRGACLVILICGALHALAGIASADPPPRIRIGWSEAPPTLDGQLEPGEWSDGAHIDGLIQAVPDPGKVASQRSEVWLMTDGEQLYIAARLWDTNPESIVARTMFRDGSTRFDDRFGFAIDPFLDRQNGYFFSVNPNGVRTDFLVEGATVEGSWDTRWYAETTIDARGWTVEIALPFSSISFDPDSDVWGLNVSRGIRRNDETDRWADPVLERFVFSMGQAGSLEGMSGIGQSLGVQVVPATILRRTDDQVENAGEFEFDPSVDIFYKVTPSLTTAVTVKTDFSETEVDQRQVNLTRFGLFFPEKRDFFTQDALIFNFGEIRENGRPFFSRRIGLGGDGEERDILVGAKATGRVGPFKIGLLDVVVDERARVDQENLLVARAAANIFGESTIGAMLTHGDPDADGENTVVGSDFVYRNSSFLGHKTFAATAWIQGSFSDPDSILNPDPENPQVDGSGLAYGGTISYPNDRIRWDIGFREFQDEFNPALGFVNRVGIREYDGTFRYRIRPGQGPFRTVDSQLEASLVTSSNATHTIRTGQFTFIPLELTTPIQDSIQFRYEHRYEFVSTAFSTLEIGPGEYHFDEGRLRVTSSRNRRIRGEFEAAYGSFFDGTRTRVQALLEVRPIKYLRLRGEYELNDIRLPGSDLLSTDDDRDRDVQIHIARIRFDIFWTPEISILTLLQYDSASDLLGFNSRLRWIIEDGREFFIVVNHGVDARGEVRNTETESIVKLQWTFRF